MNELTAPPGGKPTRSIGQVTEEINYLTTQAQRLVLGHAIEIGRRLTEARALLPHGEWGRWLREEVHYSSSSASNLMKIYDAYGDTQMSLFGVEEKSQTFGNLEYSKALALLSMPENEREDFAKEVDAQHLSVRQLKAEIKARQETQEDAENRARGWELKCQQAEEQAARSVADLTDALPQAEQAQAAEQAARADLEARDNALKLANQRLADHSAQVEQLQKELEAQRSRPPETVVQTVDASAEQLARAERRGKQEGEQAAQAALNGRIAQAEEQARAAEKAAQEARDALEQANRRLAGQEQVKALAEVNATFRQLQETLHQLTARLAALDDVPRQRTKGALERVLTAALEEMRHP